MTRWKGKFGSVTRAVFCRRKNFHWLVIVVAVVLAVQHARANPQGMTIQQGTVFTSQNGTTLDITASQNAVINWQSFNIGAGETTTFHQPNSVSVVWNQIFDANPSQIWGNLNANGIVVLMNQNGFYFGPNSSINVGGFIATTVPVFPGPSPEGGFWQYTGAPPLASIVNYGEIKVQEGGSLFMIAEKIENHGVLSAPDGTLGLYAGKEVLLSERPDGRGLSVNVRLPEGSIDNTGKIIADAGTIALHAEVVNQNGLIQANSIRNQNGVIELVASDAVNLGVNSVIQANGDVTAISSAGEIAIKSAGSLIDNVGSRIEAHGSALGGDGGQIEISALNIPGIHSELDGSAAEGWHGGTLLFDPYDIVLANTGNGTPSGNIPSGDSPGSTLRLNVNQAFAGFSQITLQATHDITFETGTLWDLNASTGINDPGSSLTLQAGNNIVFGNNARLRASDGWSVTLEAGVDFSQGTPVVQNGVGSIYLNGGPMVGGVVPNLNGSIETANGNITLHAGHEILVGSGFVRTVNGGNIFITTGDGDVDAGTKADTYEYIRQGQGYIVSSLGLGGIGTANGGNVNINSGRDILAFVGNIGAFGAAAGNLNLGATRDIKGRFLVRNGIGTLIAGHDVGGPGNPATFGLISGGWNVNAANDIFVNEVYNPNGSFNPNRLLFGARVAYQYDYAPNAFASFNGGHSVQLLGNNPARSDRPPIYAPILNVVAGAGGVTLGNHLILAPSPQGSLNIQTSDGGGLQSVGNNFYQIVISDSDSPDYHNFAATHAATPVHLGGQGSVHLDISGDVRNLFVSSPMASDIRIRGDALNFAFEGQNLGAGQTTRLQIDGDLSSRSDRTTITLTDVNLSIFTDPQLSVNPALGNRITYDPTTHRLTIQGIMTAADLAFLQNPMVYVRDPITGGLKLDNEGNPVMQAAVFTADSAALQQLYNATQDIPTSSLARGGLQLGGPGLFDISAHDMDLGISSGIRTVGAYFNNAVAQVSAQSANIRLTLAGDLDMTSSQIASFNGGGIVIDSGGSLRVGSQESFTSDDTPKGIFTAHGGGISVHAVNDINVDGSRIATYDGGDINIISDLGTVDAGGGAKGFFGVFTTEINPVTGQLVTKTRQFFGSGIVALTRVDSDVKVGDISIKAGGDILANSGGVLQLAFNNHDQSTAKVLLDAGGSIKANQSGVLGGNVELHAVGDIEGLVVAARDIAISSDASVAVTALAGGAATVSAGEGVSGSIVGGGNVSVSGSEVTASVISTGGSASTSGDASGAAVGAFNGVSSAAAEKTTEDAQEVVAAQAEDKSMEDEAKKQSGGKGPALTKRVGRVTVILPKT